MARELTTDTAMLTRLVAPAGKDVLDVGCGSGVLVRELVTAGARAVGLEISAEQLAPALAGDPDRRARYLIGRAEQLPLDDAALDLVVFMRALHHVPSHALSAALREARRVLRPDGAVYVAEPLPEGDYFELTSIVEDELAVRRAAQGAIGRAAEAGLDRTVTIEYEVRATISGVDGLRRRIVGVDPARAPVFDARADEIAAAFERLGEAGDANGERSFRQPMRADVLEVAADLRPAESPIT